MLRLALVAALAGCYSPRVTPGVACVSACPGEQVCVEGICRDPGDIDDAAIDAVVADATIDGAPDVDTDGDGLFDNVDNCIDRANADQHDEDHDAFGDVCDPCPHIAIGGVTDSDTDGVGDACDPAPTSAKQAWAYFDPFTSRRTEWSASGGATFANDQMRLSGYIDLALVVPNARVQLGGSVTIGTAVPHQAAMEFGNLDDNHYYYAEFYDEGDGGGVKVTKFDGTDYFGVFGTDYPNTIPNGAFTWTVDYSFAAQTVAFGATHGALTFPMMSAAATAPALGSTTRLFFGTNHVTWTLDYIAVIATL